MNGMIFNIQKYSINDGPGIRTTVFLKGCPLDCIWCHNPESQNTYKEITYDDKKCISCKSCVANCKNGCFTESQSNIRVNFETCSMCSECESQCPSEAIKILGHSKSVKEIIDEVIKDRMFYEESGGGVTFSGGEPMMQIDFLNSLLDHAKSKGLHTAIDTSGYCSEEDIDKIIDKVDLFLYDIKHMDEEKHIKLTGHSNKQILKNLQKLITHSKNIWIRIPIIPTINDEIENILKIGEFLNSLNQKKVFLLPYHNISKDKYIKLSRNYALNDIKTRSHEYYEQIASYLKKYNLNVKIGG
ncbi:glycyl-radical enzyme activating protein [Clostridiaceae bacterium M8S5]|nr:glycyl-radical enzyme activating protein [Clostridiaceae bacterium M8S5]